MYFVNVAYIVIKFQGCIEKNQYKQQQKRTKYHVQKSFPEQEISKKKKIYELAYIRLGKDCDRIKKFLFYQD